MYPVSARFLAALHGSHVATSRAQAYSGGSPLVTHWPHEGGTLLPIESGIVTVDGTSDVRRKLDLTLGKWRGLYDLLAPVGTEIRCWRGIRYPDQSVEEVPLGVFVIDDQDMDYAPDGTLQLTAPDRWVRIQRARFLSPEKSVSTNRADQEIARLAQAAFTSWPGWAQLDTFGSAPAVGKVTWERDRAQAILDLATSIGAQVYFDGAGLGVLKPTPGDPGTPVWTVDASVNGVQLGASRRRSRQRTYNTIVAWGQSSDGSNPIARVVVYDDDPTSPTYYLGPMGAVPYFYSSPLLKNTTQSTAAAESLLVQKKGLAAQLTLRAIVNPALDYGDTIDVLLLPETAGSQRPVEYHVIDSLTIPLTVVDPQDIDTRSSRPEEDEQS